MYMQEFVGYGVTNGVTIPLADISSFVFAQIIVINVIINVIAVALPIPQTMNSPSPPSHWWTLHIWPMLRGGFSPSDGPTRSCAC